MKGNLTEIGWSSQVHSNLRGLRFQIERLPAACLLFKWLVTLTLLGFVVGGKRSESQHFRFQIERCCWVSFHSTQPTRAITFPFKDFSFVMKFECPEQGMTGIRDTAIFEKLNDELKFDADGNVDG